MSRGTKTTTFRIPLDVKEKAAERGRRDGRTLADVVVHALEQYGEGITPPPPKRDAAQGARAGS